MDNLDRLKGALNTLHEAPWKTTFAKLFGKRVET